MTLVGKNKGDIGSDTKPKTQRRGNVSSTTQTPNVMVLKFRSFALDQDVTHLHPRWWHKLTPWVKRVYPDWTYDREYIKPEEVNR